MSVFRNDSISNLLSRVFVFTKDEEGIVWTQDNNCFLITKDEAAQLIEGLKKYVDVDEDEINNHNEKLHTRYDKQLKGK